MSDVLKKRGAGMKTYEEIADEIRNQINIGFDHTDGKDKTVLAFYDSDAEIILKAFEKQIPKKPRYYIDNWGHNRPGCPGCPRNEILYVGQKYCKVCGTKIDWGKE